MTDLLQRLDEAANDTHYIDHITAREAAARIRALEAQLAAPVAVKAKPLVWECLGENHWRAKTPFPFTIRAENYGDGFAVGWSVPGFSDVFVPGRFAGIEAAKATAQADYEARILAALDVAPDPRVAALMETLQDVADECLSDEIPEGYGPDLTENPEFHRGYDAALHRVRLALASFKGDDHG